MDPEKTMDEQLAEGFAAAAWEEPNGPHATINVKGLTEEAQHALMMMAALLAQRPVLRDRVEEERLRAELAKVNGMYGDAVTKLLRQSSTSATLQAQLTDLRAAMRGVEDALKASQKDAEVQRERGDRNYDVVCKTVSERQEALVRLAEADKENQKLQSDLAASEQASRSHQRQADHNYEELRKAIKGREEQRQRAMSLEEELEATQADVVALRNQVKELEGTKLAQGLQEQLRAAQKDRDEWRKRANDLEAAFTEIYGKVNSLLPPF